MQTTIQVGEGAVPLEYQLAKHVVVFSHGFGVGQDARGMFTDIKTALPRGWGYVLFSYDTFDGVTSQRMLVGAEERVSILQAVIDWGRTQSGVVQVHVIGHSMGSLTIANLAPEGIGAMILLAPPLSLGSRLAERFTKRTGAVHDGNTWHIPRGDDTTSIISDERLASIMNIDAEGELAKLALFRPYTIVLAGVDEVIPDADYTALITMPSVTMVGIDTADHDFSGAARAELVDTVTGLLKAAVGPGHLSDEAF